MVRRWFIRLPFLLALAFVVGMWVTSYFGYFSGYKWIGGTHWEVGAVQGLAFLTDNDLFPVRDSPLRFSFKRHATAEEWLPESKVLGFYVGQWAEVPPTWRWIIFPLWLPTLLLMGLNWFIWRKTRPKMAGRAFPVEPAAKSGESKP